jgi:iron complex transport system substrate-binding protein
MAAAYLGMVLLVASTIWQNSSAADERTTPHKKVVSLAPSNTELIFSIGAEQELAADSTFCDFPPAAKEKPKAGTFQSVNFEKMFALKPDVVLLVSGQEALAATINQRGFRTIVLSNNSLADIGFNILAIGKATGHMQSATAIAGKYQQLLNDLRQLTAAAKHHPRTFCLVWAQPLLTVGTSSYLHDAITICGGNNISGALATAYPKYSPERLLIDQPDTIIVAHRQDPEFLKRPPWSSLDAVRNNRVHMVSAEIEDRLDRPTLRILDGLFWLASALHPELQDKLSHWHRQAQDLTK